MECFSYGKEREMLGTYTPGKFNKFTQTFEKLAPVPCKFIEYLPKEKVKIKILGFLDNQPNPTITVKIKYVKFQEEPKQLTNYYEPCQKD